MLMILRHSIGYLVIFRFRVKGMVMMYVLVLFCVILYTLVNSLEPSLLRTMVVILPLGLCLLLMVLSALMLMVRRRSQYLKERQILGTLFSLLVVLACIYLMVLCVALNLPGKFKVSGCVSIL